MIVEPPKACKTGRGTKLLFRRKEGANTAGVGAGGEEKDYVTSGIQ